MKPKIVTIGAYGFDKDSFFQALIDAKIDTFCDIRRRRGMRGAVYAFANSENLQRRLSELGIRYIYVRELAPSKEIREQQKQEDEQLGIAKRARTELGQLWDIDFHSAPEVTPPHVEDVIVTREQYVSRVPDIGTMLLQRVQPWRGVPVHLFDGLLTFRNGRGYISRMRGISSGSTGFWIPDKPLKRVYDRNKVYYSYAQTSLGSYMLPYVGYMESVAYIPAGALIRVSLARWWTPEGMPEPRCYLQLSGWYL